MAPEKQRSRFTYLGFCGLQSLITYELVTKTVTKGSEKVILENSTFFDYMQDLLSNKKAANGTISLCISLFSLHIDPTLPFSLQGGMVGYLGYEMGQESGMAYPLKTEGVVGFGETPDAAFVLVEKLIVLDMLEKGRPEKAVLNLMLCRCICCGSETYN